LLRGTFKPAARTHATASLLLGAGGLGAVDNATRRAHVRSTPVADADALLEANLTKFLRMGLSAGYRFVPARFQGLGAQEWSGPTIGAQWATGAF
jgi:hypothetical protein